MASLLSFSSLVCSAPVGRSAGTRLGSVQLRGEVTQGADPRGQWPQRNSMQHDCDGGPDCRGAGEPSYLAIRHRMKAGTATALAPFQGDQWPRRTAFARDWMSHLGLREVRDAERQHDEERMAPQTVAAALRRRETARKLASADRREAASRESPRDPARSVGRELDRLEAQLSEAEDALERT